MLVLAIVLFVIFGLSTTQKILSCLSIIVGLPIGIFGLLNVIRILDEEKLINKALIKAGKQEEMEGAIPEIIADKDEIIEHQNRFKSIIMKSAYKTIRVKVTHPGATKEYNINYDEKINSGMPQKS
jgi:hypothetical protein